MRDTRSVALLALAGAALLATLEAPALGSAVDGRAIFVERCSACHGERGDKELAGGPPLSKRTLTAKQIAETVKSRMPRASDDERRAVAAYIASITREPHAR